MIETLLVEDNDALRQALQVGLEGIGDVHIVDRFATGEEAVAYCRTSAPDVVLMDVELAGEMNGIQAAVSLRRAIPMRVNLRT